MSSTTSQAVLQPTAPAAPPLHTIAAPPRCRSCDAGLSRTFVDLGHTPLANSYLSAADLERPEPTYPLHARVCDGCLLVQLDAVVAAEEIFSDYAYFSSYSSSWLAHAARYVDDVTDWLGLGTDSFVVEIASNDGYLLRNFVERGIAVLGVEPAANVAAIAEAAGVPTDVRFFGLDTATDIVASRGRADLVVANNVLAHVPDLQDFVAGLAALVAPTGVVSIEFPHLLELMNGVQFDTIYHEHFSYFSLLAVERVLADHGLGVFDVHQLPTHGGSLRILAAPRAAARPEGEGLLGVRTIEAAAGLDRLETYDGWFDKVARCRTLLRQFLAGARRAGHTVVAYGAAAKGNTLLNFCGVGTDDIAYVVDRSPHKQGRFLPGSRLPILSPDAVAETKPAYLLILPWNIRDEVVSQMSCVRDWGGRFVVAVPTVQVSG